MRLTLRTLLAYMDDILEPADHEALARKIEASDFATELIHRSRDASRRLRLGAPDPSAGEAGDLHEGADEQDANAMAEYLDNTLSPEAVAEFERACLAPGDKGDMLLAEAVSCHHVLAMVLREPAEVDRDLRRRLYDLAGTDAQPAKSLRIEPAHAAHAPDARPAERPASIDSVTAPARVASSGTPAAAHHALPDYLQAAANENRKKRRLMYAAIAAMIAGVLVGMLWPRGDQEARNVPEVPDAAASDGDTQSASVAEAAPDDADEGNDQEPESDAAEAAPPEDAAGGESSGASEAVAVDPGAEAPASNGETLSDLETKPNSDAASLPPDPGALPELPPGTDDQLPTADEEVADNDVAGDDGQFLDEPMTDEAETVASADVPGTPPRLGSGSPTGSAPPNEGTPGEPAKDAAPADEQPADAPAPPANAADQGPQPLGAFLGFMGADDVLLAYDPRGGAWRRLPSGEPLYDGTRLLALPTFRTTVNLAGANVYLGGGTEVTVLEPNQVPGEAAVDVALRAPRGRLIINAGRNGNRLELLAGDESRIIQLNPSSTLAVEVQGHFEPGFDPRVDPVDRTIRWYLASGGGQFIAGDGSELAVTGPAQWETTGRNDSAPAPIEQLPEWVDHEVVTSVQRSARKYVAPALTPGAPVDIALAELSDPNGAGRRYEVRTLAAVCAAYVDQFEPMVKALGDIQQKPYWKRLIETTRQTLAEDPDAVVALEEALISLRGERDAAGLMELILGYSPEDIGQTPAAIQAGPIPGLLRNLDSEDLDFRVLAFHNLCELTGTAGFGYRPERSADQRARVLRVIWKRFEEGELLPAQSGP